jgi:POT family proton-dependent oligopeptide transporter
MMMGICFASFIGNYGAGYLGHYWEKMPKDAFFLMIAAMAFCAGVAILLILRPLKRAMWREQSM